MNTKPFWTLLILISLTLAAAPLPSAHAAGDVMLGAVEVSRLAADDPGFTDRFGWSVAVSGNLAVVGARSEDPHLGGDPINNAGAAYIFARQEGAWVQQAKLVPRDANPGDAFGTSVAIDGGTVVVGAVGEDLEDEPDIGAAYVFTLLGNTWVQQAKLVAPDYAEGDNFGVSVAVYGNTIIVGADGKDLDPFTDAGAAYLFTRQGDSWDHLDRLEASDARLGGAFGSSVAVRGDKLVIGAPGDDPFGRGASGSAYLYTRGSVSWKEEAVLGPEDGHPDDFFGHSVAVSGETVVVGAVFADPNLGAGRLRDAGAAYVFTEGRQGWDQDARLVAGEAAPMDHFGQSVDVYGDNIVIGASGKDYYGDLRAGAAFLFKRSGKDWVQQTKMLPDNTYSDDAFGESVAIDGNLVLVGAAGRPAESLSRAGEAFVYKLVPMQLPATGFPPGVSTPLDLKPPSVIYTDLGDLWLDIPALGVQTSIISIPRLGEGWQITWLWGQAGYLEGTAFPTWQGNTAISAHVYLPDGNPGPFVDLHTLAWGDRFTIHAWGQDHVYEVREVLQVHPGDLSVITHEEHDWVTLITCQHFDEATGTYPWRTAVRAVLVGVQKD